MDYLSFCALVLLVVGKSSLLDIRIRSQVSSPMHGMLVATISVYPPIFKHARERRRPKDHRFGSSSVKVQGEDEGEAEAGPTHPVLQINREELISVKVVGS